MAHDGWLTKSEVNTLYYNTVGGAIAFVTEAQASLHTAAVAKLIALQARGRGASEIRILEIGANNGAFARALLGELRSLVEHDQAELTRVDYLAVEFARASLEAAAHHEAHSGRNDRVLRPGDRGDGAPVAPGTPSLVALISRVGALTTHLGLVHADANAFVGASRERFDVAILNELLDDLPYRAFYADAQGRRHELHAHAGLDGALWRIRVSASETDDAALADMPAATLTATSAESVELVTGIADLLVPGGMLLIHDYGFATPFPRLEPYTALPRSIPPSAELEFPPGAEEGFPRGFYRVFGNEDYRVVQITNDVNFAELARALAPGGRVVTLAHGNAIVNDPASTGLTRGDGVFLSEFGLLDPTDDLPALLAELDAAQEGFREAYVRDRMGGRESIYADLVFVKD